MRQVPGHPRSVLVWILCAGFASTLLAREASVPQAAMEPAQRPSSQEATEGDCRQEASALLDSLRASTPRSPAAKPILVERRADAPEQEPPLDRRIRVGRADALGADVSFRGLRADQLTPTPRDLRHGTIQSGELGGFVWNGSVASSGAAALRLRFTAFYLPRQAALYLWTEQGDVFGPYTGRGIHGDGEFWSHTLRGSTVNLQLRYEGVDLDNALRAARFVIADVGHLTRAFPFGSEGPEAGSNLCAENEPCVENAECTNLPAAIKPAQDAVAAIIFQSGAFLYLCSGGLIADTDPGSVIPYFLTANHCLSRDREARSVEAYFQYRSKDCKTDSCALSGSPIQINGASLVATNRTSDYSLLRLAALPAGAVLLGWTASPVASLDGAPLHRISHPSGSPQAYSSHVVDTDRPTCSSWPRGPWIYSSDTFGATEGGSSGSPVVNGSGQIVGQLSGACGFNVSDSCDAAANATVDGAFANYYSQVASILDPVTSCTDADGDGFCMENGDCDDGDPTIHPGAIEVCDDGKDNDCDGAIDAADTDCQTGSCDLGGLGSLCASDVECCSNKCRGKPGAKTCR